MKTVFYYVLLKINSGFDTINTDSTDNTVCREVLLMKKLLIFIGSALAFIALYFSTNLNGKKK